MITKSKTTPRSPKKIFLQWLGADKANLSPEKLTGIEEPWGVTWCSDRIYDTDVEYQIVRPYEKKRKSNSSKSNTA